MVSACISTHGLTRRPTCVFRAPYNIALFQLTASRGGRRPVWPLFGHREYISTHGLTRRPTAISDKNTSSEIDYFVSIAYNIIIFQFIQAFPLLFFQKSPPFSGANASWNFCMLIFRTIKSEHLLHQIQVSLQCVLLYFCNFLPNNKISNYLHFDL